MIGRLVAQLQPQASLFPSSTSCQLSYNYLVLKR
jgi:hypothetical protein